MGPPIRQLSPELIREHPGLAVFYQYIQQHNDGVAPRPEQIQVQNAQTNDGQLDIGYVTRDNRLFIAHFTGPTGFLQMRHGRLVHRGQPEPQWVDRQGQEVAATEQHVAGACHTLQTLGGNEEANAQCIEFSPTQLHGAHGTWYGIFGGLWWASSETLLRPLLRPVWKQVFGANFHRSPTAAMVRTLRGAIPQSTASLSPLHGVSTGIGALAMGLSYPLADGLGFHRQYHHHERYALSATLGYGSYLGSRALLNRFARGPALPRVGLGSSLVSAALVNATFGGFYDAGSPERHAIATASFFLPQAYRTFSPTRATALAEQRGLSGAFSRSVGRVVVGAFALDAGYMIYNRIANGGEGSARVNRLYARANHLQSQARTGVIDHVVGLFDIGAEMLVPAIAERYFVPDRYVSRAREEMLSLAAQEAAQVNASLRHSLLFHPYGKEDDPSFHQQVDLEWLRGENQLADITRSDGQELPIAMVAEQLEHSRHFRTRVEPRGEEAILNYIVDQFSGYNLSRADAREVLSRISIYHTRERIAGIHTLVGPEDQPLVRFFDAEGRLRAGQDQALVNYLFPETGGEPTQLLALRREIPRSAEL